ncbi:MAG: hypothetical protein KF912_09515 [Phycisphaeraceae bacterium]|nr:hypothetical protein [Phycisphaeraceae bacterium]MBX3367532.1 hypothetical protein [Phycisphaeraceae bacterium]
MPTQIKSLPDPTWSDSDATCVACAYSLAGLTLPAHCPECGTLHEARQLIVAGIPSIRSIMSPARLCAVIATIALAFVISQLGPIFAIRGHWMFVLAALVVCVGAGILLARSAPRAQGGACRMAFTPGRVSVIGPDGATNAAHPATVAFRGNERVELRQISDFWANIRIRGTQGLVFQAGIRCPRSIAPETLNSIRAAVHTPQTHSGDPTEAGVSFTS